jgi:hypothetical protein
MGRREEFPNSLRGARTVPECIASSCGADILVREVFFGCGADTPVANQSMREGHEFTRAARL